MTLPLPLAGVDEATSTDHAQCGKLAAEAVVGAFTGTQVALDIVDNATAEQIAAGINAAKVGLLATVTYADVAATEASELPHDHGLVVGVNCSAGAQPVGYVTGIRHWLAQTQPGLAYNCWGRTYTAVNLEATHNAQMGTVVVVSEDHMNISQKCALVRTAYLSALGREPESFDTLKAWAANVADDGSNADQIVAAIADSPEGIAYRARIHALTTGQPVTAGDVAKIVESDIAKLLADAASQGA